MSRRTDEERERDARHNEAARRAMVRTDQARSPGENLERAAALQRAAEEFQQAFATVLGRRDK